MAGFNTSQDAMAAGAVHVEECSDKVQGQINKLRTDVETMMANWGGSAATAFTTLHQNFEQQANQINNALRNMHEALGATRATYAAQEEQEAQNIASMANQINEA